MFSEFPLTLAFVIPFFAFRTFLLYWQSDLTGIRFIMELIRFVVLGVIFVSIENCKKNRNKYRSYSIVLLFVLPDLILCCYYYEIYKYGTLLQIFQYYPSNRRQVDDIQEQFKCCGLTSYEEYAIWGLPVPTSCRPNDKGADFYKESCSRRLSNVVSSNGYYLLFSVSLAPIFYLLYLLTPIKTNWQGRKETSYRAVK